jgi:hypothetical protein
LGREARRARQFQELALVQVQLARQALRLVRKVA